MRKQPHPMRSLRKQHRKAFDRWLTFEHLEDRLTLAADFGDAPAPYSTTLFDNGARHEAVGPILGSTRDVEVDGLPSAAADGDGDDEDGVQLAELRVGHIRASAIVEVSNAPAGAVLNAWLDLNHDGTWSGLDELIAHNVAVADGINTIYFSIPSSAASGVTFARFRISTSEGLNPFGFAADGEVEDYAVEILSARGTGTFGNRTLADTPYSSAIGIMVDIDRDGDIDAVVAREGGSTSLSWLENDGFGSFVTHSLTFGTRRMDWAHPADIDADGDIDLLSGSAARNGGVFWLENDGSQAFSVREIPLAAHAWVQDIQIEDIDGDSDPDFVASADDKIFWYENVHATFTPHIAAQAVFSTMVSTSDLDRDGDMDLLSAYFIDGMIFWYENNGSQEFVRREIASGPVGGRSVFPTDFDLDGDTDLLSVSSTDERITWHENNGAASFAAHFVHEVTVNARGVSTADIEGDGDVDILAAFGEDLVWLQNDGQFSFSQKYVGFHPSPAWLGAADIDGDTDLDLVASSHSRSDIAWFANTNPACDNCADSYTFAEDSSEAVPSSAGLLSNDDSLPGEVLTVRVGTLPAHGELSLSSNSSFVYLPDAHYVGHESFLYRIISNQRGPRDAEVSISIQPVNDPPHAIGDSYRIEPGGELESALSVLANDGDIDGDELEAVLVADVEHGILSLKPDGTFIYAPAAGFTGVDSFRYAAFDGTVPSNAVTVTIVVVLPTTDFGDSPTPYPTTSEEAGAWHEAIGPKLGASRDQEFDGQHSPDAGSDAADDGIVFDDLRVGALRSSATVDVSDAPAGARLDAWIDFNRDGFWGGPSERIARAMPLSNGSNTIRFDVPSWAPDGMTFARFRLSSVGGLGIGGPADDGEVEDYAVLIQPPSPTRGVFGEQNIITSAIEGASDVFATDLDQDGDMDVLTASGRDDRIVWFENDGLQVFSERVISLTANDPRSVTAGDLDGDGDFDVIAASVNDNMIRWFENNGLQQFTEHLVSSDEDFPHGLSLADMDGDGDMDVLASRGFDDKVNWFENDGNEGFIKRLVATSLDTAGSVQPVDIDGDGDMDVLGGAFVTHVLWFENDGHQMFTQRGVPNVFPRARSVVATDLDGDGDMDVAAASSSSEAVVWYENIGGRNFTRRVIQTSIHTPQNIVAADVDGDRDSDLVVPFYTDNTVVWYENDGGQVFLPHTITVSASSAQKVFVADVDDDGSLDILSASSLDDKIAWYENLFCNDCDDQYDIEEDLRFEAMADTGVLANDQQRAGEELSATLLRMPNHGTLEFFSSGAFTYIPAANFFGVDTFVYRVTSNVRGSRDAIVTLNIAPTPDAPRSVDDTYEVETASTLVVDAAAVSTALISRMSAWKYLDNGTDQGTAWRDRGFDDTAWKSGPAELGYGDGDEATVVDCGPAAGNECVAGGPNVSNRYITTYFRRVFDLDDPSAVTALAANVRRDDGVVVYLNGVELFREYMQDGPFTYLTHATAFASDDGEVFVPFVNLDRSALVAGVNVIAVEIHQQWPGSSDMSFDLELIADAFPSPRSVLANDFEPDQEHLSAELLSSVANGTLMFDADGSFHYAPMPGFIGIDEFSYRFSDGESWSQAATVRIVVSPPGKAPQDLNADGRVDEGDLAFLLGSFGKASNAKAIEGDLDGDGRIGMRDAIALRNAFTPSPAPAAAVVAKVSDRANVQVSEDLDALRVARRQRRPSDGVSTATLAATDQALAASTIGPDLLRGRRSRWLNRRQG